MSGCERVDRWEEQGEYVTASRITAIAVTGISLHFVLRYGASAPPIAYLIPLYVVLVFGGAPLIAGLARKVRAGEFGADLLAGVSLVTSLLLDQYLVGAIVVLMLAGGIALEEFATRRASADLRVLAKRAPKIFTAVRAAASRIWRFPMSL
jgi:cation transport ATPase